MSLGGETMGTVIRAQSTEGRNLPKEEEEEEKAEETSSLYLCVCPAWMAH